MDSVGRADEVERHPPPADDDVTAESSPYDEWELDQELRHIGRMVSLGNLDHSSDESHAQASVVRLDPPHDGPAAWHTPPAPRRRPAKPKRKPGGTRSALTWGILSLGTMAFVCGGILMGWSLLADRTELWEFGMPVALGGQIALLLGLVLQLDRLWHDSRHAADKLDDVDEQLHELKTTTTMLGTGHATPGSAFYAHLADGAGPDLLLHDLKGQLDLLAMKISMGDERKAG